MKTFKTPKTFKEIFRSFITDENTVSGGDVGGTVSGDIATTMGGKKIQPMKRATTTTTLTHSRKFSAENAENAENAEKN